MNELERIDKRVMIGSLGDGKEMKGKKEERLVNNGENGEKEIVGIEDKIEGRIIIINEEGGIEMDENILLDGKEGKEIEGEGIEVLIKNEIRKDEKRNKIKELRREIDKGKKKMDDVLRNVVLERRDKNIMEGDIVSEIGLRKRDGEKEKKIGEEMRIGKVNSEGKGEIKNIRKIGVIMIVGEVGEDRGDRELSKERINGERNIGRRNILEEGSVKKIGKKMKEILIRKRKEEKEELEIEIIGLIVEIGSGEGEIRMKGEELEIRSMVEGEESELRKIWELRKDWIEEIGRWLGKERKIVVKMIIKKVVEKEISIIKRREINWNRDNKNK